MSVVDDSFQLFDLRVEVVVPKGAEGKRILCGAKEGDYLLLQGEMMTLPEGQGFSIYSLGKKAIACSDQLGIDEPVGAILPLLAAKQRCRDEKDWMWTDAEIACPDPNCPTRLRIVRTGIRTFSHASTTVTPLQPDNS